MRFPIWWYLSGVCVLALGCTPTWGQSTPSGSGSSTDAASHRLICGDMSTAAVARIQGESRPRLPDAYQTQHFVLYYTHQAAGNHAPDPDDADRDGTPDYVENLGTYFERAWSVYTTATPEGLGYDAPPRPSGRYPICIYSLPDGFSGQTWPDSISGRRAVSHISIDSHLYEPYVRAVAAHELFHAFQFGYNYSASVWWKEASAEWASNEVFPDVDTYIIPYYDWFQVPGWSLDYTDGWHEYGDSVWAKYLAETHGRDFIRSIWINQKTDNDSVRVITKSLASIGTTLAAQFRDFATWNWFTGDRADGAHYAQGQNWPELTTNDSTPGTTGPISGSVQHLGSAYLPIEPSRDSVAAAKRPTRTPVASIQARRVSGYLPAAAKPVISTSVPTPGRLKAEDITASPVARGLTIRLKADAGLDAQLILERPDGTRSTVPMPSGRYHVAGFEQAMQRVVVVICNGDPAATHRFTGTVGLGVVYRDQYGYVWDMEIAPDGTVHGTVDVGDQQPWTVQGQIRANGFHWRVVNPSVRRGWGTGFDVTGTLPDPAGSSVRWTNDAGRTDLWSGAPVDGPVSTAPVANSLRGPALP